VSVSLYKLTGAYQRLMDIATDDEDEEGLGFSQPFIETLEALDDELDIKFEGCARALKSMAALKESLDAEASLLRKRAARLDLGIEELKGYIKYCMEQAGFKKRQSGLFKFSIVENSQPSVTVMDLDEVPTKFDKPTERTVSLSAIRDAFKAGEIVPGVDVVRGNHLRVS
jgi:hypothetical protein